jgi:acetolactate synthase-1/2/3 large subunit
MPPQLVTVRRHTGLLLVDLLVAAGIERVFGVPGGQTMALYDGILERQPAIRHVLVRDERTAAYAADAYARLTGRVAACDATVGPGAAKLPSGLGEALNASIPVLALVSDLPRDLHALRHRGIASQALDQAALLAPVTKWLAEVPSPEELPELFGRAVLEATSGRPGPVALILPQDVLDADAPDLPVAPPRAEFPAARLEPDAAEIEAAAEVLRRAERPFVLAGGGALIAGAGAATLALAERLQAAVGTTLTGKGAVPEGHPLAVGVVGSFGTTAARTLLERADTVCLLGAKGGSMTTFGFALPRADQEIVHVDVEPRLGTVATADARLGAEALAAALPQAERAPWTAAIATELAGWRATRDDERGRDDEPIVPQRVAAELERALRPDDVVCSDASLANGWAAVYVEQASPGRQLLSPRGLAGLGFGVPAAIGAAEARPGARVFVLVGDGGLAYAVGELATIAERSLPVTVVVLNNRSLGWIRWYRRIAWGRGHERDDFGAVDFAAVARAFGLAATRVEHASDLAEALALPGPALVDVVTAVWETPHLGQRAAARSY